MSEKIEIPKINNKNRVNYTLFINIGVSITALTLMTLHLFKVVSFDKISIIFFSIALIPWLIPFLRQYLKSSKILGTEFEFLETKINDQEKKIENQRIAINDQQEIINKLVTYSLAEQPYILLWELSTCPTLIFKNDNTFKRWMNMLLDTGLIQPKETLKWLDFDNVSDGQNLVDISKPTPAGNFLINLRGNPHNK